MHRVSLIVGLTQPTVLNLLYAQLELDYGYIRAVTPCYAVYDIKQRTADGWQAILKDTSTAAQIIREHWRSHGMGYQVCLFCFSGSYNRIRMAHE